MTNKYSSDNEVDGAIVAILGLAIEYHDMPRHKGTVLQVQHVSGKNYLVTFTPKDSNAILTNPATARNHTACYMGSFRFYGTFEPIVGIE